MLYNRFSLDFVSGCIEWLLPGNFLGPGPGRSGNHLWRMQKTTLANSRPAATVEAVRAAHAAKLLAVAKLQEQFERGEFERDLDKADKIQGSLTASMLALKVEMTELTEQLSEMPNGFVASAATVEAVQAALDVVGSTGDIADFSPLLVNLANNKGWEEGRGHTFANEDMVMGDIAEIYVCTRVDIDGIYVCPRVVSAEADVAAAATAAAASATPLPATPPPLPPAGGAAAAPVDTVAET
jgi:hypothetical protein